MRRPPKILFWCFPAIIWHRSRKKKVLYITFDDGPHPDTTPWILSTLSHYNAQTSFFCLGENALKYPQLIEELKSHGHTIGIHGFHHLDGWKTETCDYIQDIKQASISLKTILFRPPYGRLKPRQYFRLKKDFKIVMWDIMSEDYLQGINAGRKAEDMIRHIKNGSIVVFHDQPQAFQNMKFLLTAVLGSFLAKGYTFMGL